LGVVTSNPGAIRSITFEKEMPACGLLVELEALVHPADDVVPFLLADVDGRAFVHIVSLVVRFGAFREL
jgi:hypothetical protein